MNAQTLHPTMEHLDDQIAWYDRKSREAQYRFKSLKILQMVSAGIIPLVVVIDALTPVAPTVAALLGFVILIVEGLQQLNQYQNNWISYRATCEALKHEKYLYLGRAGPYAGAGDPIPQLADRIEGLISQEHAKWVSVQEQVGKAPAPAPAGAGKTEA